jgi:hypothetical protein
MHFASQIKDASSQIEHLHKSPVIDGSTLSFTECKEHL